MIRRTGPDIAGWVYRCVNVAGETLYIGHTLNLRPRLASHKKKPWWGDVACVRSSRFSRWEDAYEQEMAEIREIRPRHNKQGNPDWSPS